jgi:hypothetical protein
MAGFLYFLPNAKQSDVPGNLSRWGLTYLVDGESPGRKLAARQCSIGGVQGMVVGSLANFAIEEIKNSDQVEWQKFPKTFAEIPPQLGIVGGAMPGPSDLAREKQISGELTTLADGNLWLLPIAKQYTEDGYANNLPTSFGLDEETGDWITDSVVPQYRAIWNHANAYLNAMTEAVLNPTPDGKFRWDIPDGMRLVVDALQANYRVSAREVATLGLMVSGIHQLVADALIDSQGWVQLKKKAEADTGPG